jgi:hypothetical protein
VDDEIIAEIRRSRFLVADFTCEPEKVRGGVYFETCFAMGLNIPIIWTCKDTSLRPNGSCVSQHERKTDTSRMAAR